MTFDNHNILNQQNTDCLKSLHDGVKVFYKVERSSFDISSISRDGCNDKSLKRNYFYDDDFSDSFLQSENTFSNPATIERVLQIDSQVNANTEGNVYTILTNSIQRISPEDDIEVIDKCSNNFSGPSSAIAQEKINTAFKISDNNVNCELINNNVNELKTDYIKVYNNPGLVKPSYEIIAESIIEEDLLDSTGHVITLLPPTLDSKNVNCLVNEFHCNGISLQASEEVNNIASLNLHSQTLIDESDPKIQSQKCKYCNYTNPKPVALSRHMKTHVKEQYKCSTCEKSFKSNSRLRAHENIHKITKLHKCTQCDKSFCTSSELGRHIRYRHTHNTLHKCHKCPYSCVELPKLKRHIFTHNGEQSFHCENCTFSSPDTHQFKLHLKTHIIDKPLNCETCRTNFPNSDLLQAHKLTHKGKLMYSCALCPCTFNIKSHLINHIENLHTSVKPIECNKCGRCLPDPYSFKIHKKIHAGEKLKCEYCPYQSKHKRQLNLHMLFHAGANLSKKHAVLSFLARRKNYSCQKCGGKFSSINALKIHFFSHFANLNRKVNVSCKVEDQKNIAICKQNLLEDEPKSENEVSLEDLDELTILDDLKLPVDSDIDQVLDMNPQSNLPENILDQLDEMYDEECSKCDTVNTENELISCLGLDELMDIEDDISLSSVF